VAWAHDDPGAGFHLRRSFFGSAFVELLQEPRLRRLARRRLAGFDFAVVFVTIASPVTAAVVHVDRSSVVPPTNAAKTQRHACVVN
jgi:hypothetical protein